VDLWCIACLSKGSKHTQAEVENIIAALDKAKKQGKARFTGVSSQHRPWLKMLIETYPEQIEVIIPPTPRRARPTSPDWRRSRTPIWRFSSCASGCCPTTR